MIRFDHFPYSFFYRDDKTHNTFISAGDQSVQQGKDSLGSAGYLCVTVGEWNGAMMRCRFDKMVNIATLSRRSGIAAMWW